MADVFSDAPTPTIVDGDVLEAAKENIQPLAAGRRVTALSALLTTPHAQREARLADSRKRHRTNVAIAMDDEDEDADPLEAYSQFVHWTVENYPQGHSAESGLLELLEEATRVLRDHSGGKWRSDIRYLKLWVLYASYVDKPTVIYKYLLVNEIGTTHALFYEEYAIALERAKRRVEADETYLLGIARKAAPVERLETKHREFQKRMMASPAIPSSSSQDTLEAVPASSATATRRKVLGEPTARSTTRARAPSSSTNDDVFSAPAPARANARLPVFVDPVGDAENDPEQANNPTPWPELGTRKSRIKENTVEVSKAAGTTLRQAGRSTRAASGSRIAVFRDAAGDDAAMMPPPPVPAPKKGRTASKGSIAVFRDEGPAESSAAPVTRGKTRSASKSSVPVFRDEVEQPPAEAASKKGKGKSPIAVFKDEDSTEAESSAKKGKTRTASKASIAVFRDEEDPAAKATPPVPSTPKFVPFKDEEEPGTPTSTATAVPGTVMRPKPAVKDVAMSAEAEALRKDPFKNYSEEERPIDD